MKILNTHKIANSLAAFKNNEDGNVSAIGLFGFIAIAAMGSFALDVTHVYSARTHLQIAADQSAHAAIYNRYLMSEDDAKAEAMSVVNATLPPSINGQVISAQNMEFGRIDADTGDFVVQAGSKRAVRVRTSFREAVGNAVPSYLMKLLGVNQFDVTTEAIYSSYKPGCLTEGFIAEGVVDIQSNNSFSNGFCLHSNTYVSLSSNNNFEPGTIVSMPNLDDLDLPRSGFQTNEGLQSALRSATMNIRILGRIDNIIYKHKYPSASYSSYPVPSLAMDTPDIPDYITNLTPISSRQRSITTAQIYALGSNSGQGRIHLMECQGQNLTIDASSQTLTNVVIISPCEIKFSSGSAVEDVRIITTATTSDSINSPSSFRVGRDDGCSEGGGAQLITTGGMRFASGLSIYGSQLLAKGDIYFSANANGVQGASFIAGGEISGTSNMNMGLCMNGMEDNLDVTYFRLAG